LPGAGGELQREAQQLWVGVSVCRSEMIEQALSVRGLRRDLGEPDRCLYRLHLAEERADIAERVMAPVLKETGGLRHDQPLTGTGQGTPGVHMTAHFVDDRSGVVLLLLRGQPLAFIENEGLLCGGFLVLLGFRDRRDEGGAAARLDD